MSAEDPCSHPHACIKYFANRAIAQTTFLFFFLFPPRFSLPSCFLAMDIHEVDVPTRIYCLRLISFHAQKMLCVGFFFFLQIQGQRLSKAKGKNKNTAIKQVNFGVVRTPPPRPHSFPEGEMEFWRLLAESCK